MDKLKSRKFWMMAAAFLASIGASIAGLATSNETVVMIGTVCTMLSAAIYAAAEAYVDAASVSSKQTVETKSTQTTLSKDLNKATETKE